MSEGDNVTVVCRNFAKPEPFIPPRECHDLIPGVLQGNAQMWGEDAQQVHIMISERGTTVFQRISTMTQVPHAVPVVFQEGINITSELLLLLLFIHIAY